MIQPPKKWGLTRRVVEANYTEAIYISTPQLYLLQVCHSLSFISLKLEALLLHFLHPKIIPELIFRDLFIVEHELFEHHPTSSIENKSMF